MTGITERLPAPLSERLASFSAAIYNRQGREVDVAIGGIPFRLATASDIPQSVETIQVRKDQFDAENDPGEQSLTGWWRRSQSSWHEGAGSLYQEDSSQAIASNGFYTSAGIDVFTPGRLTLLRKMLVKGQVGGTALSRIKTYTLSGVRTNQCTNPSLETNVTGWTPSNGGNAPDLPTFTRDTSKFVVGAACGRLDWATDDATGFPPGVQIPTATLPANATYTVSCQVWVPTGSVAVQLVGNSVFGAGSGATKDAWVTLTLKSTADGSGNTNIFIWPTTPAGVGQKFYVDVAIVESNTNIVGSYFDGGYGGPGVTAWTGTVNNSTSTLTLANQLPNLSAVASGALHTASGDPASGSFASLHAPGGKTIVDALISGTTFYDVASDGTLYQGDVSAPGSATTWPCGTTPYRLSWGKHRLWMIGGRKLWQPDVTLSGGTTQNPIFIHPNLGWTYTCIAEGPAAMYFGGHAGNTSSIQAVTLDTGGAVPTLTGAQNTTILPDGELVQEISILAGQYVGIGTNKGFRVGAISGTNITYGPLIIEPAGVIACTAMTTQGKFFLVSFSTSTGTTLAYKVDTSEEIANGVFPYASDVDCGFTGSITSLASGAWDSGAGSVPVTYVTTSDGRPWAQSTSLYVSTGYLQTGRIRYRTTELKAFKFLSVEIEPLAGNVQCDLILEGGTTLPVGNITAQGEVFSDIFSISVGTMRYASVKFTLTPNSAATGAPVVNSYLLKALPAVAPQRLMVLPLLCYDREQAISGQRYGGQGFARDRLSALQILEDLGDTVTYQDFSAIAGGGQTVTIESIKFVQTSPAPSSRSEGAGGILVLQLRTANS